MAIAYKSQGAAAATVTSGAALSPACPATVDAGDILIAHVCWKGTTDAPTTPSGWTLLSGPHNIGTTVAGRHWVFGMIAVGTEDGAAVSFGAPAVTTHRYARIYSFSGRVSGAITDLVSGFSSIPHATDPQGPSVTTASAGALAVALLTQSDDNAIAAITGMTGGTWSEPVAEHLTALGTGAMQSINVCTPAPDPGTVSGGAVVATNDPAGTIGFQIQDTGAVAHSQPANDSIAGSDAQAKAVGTAKADSAAAADAVSRAWVAGVTRGDFVAATDALGRAAGHSLADAGALSDSLETRLGHALSIPDSAGLTDSAAASAAGHHTRSIDDGLTAADVLAKGPRVARGDALVATDSLGKAVVAARADTASVTDALSRAAAMVRVIADMAVLADNRTAELGTGEAWPWFSGPTDLGATPFVGGLQLDSDIDFSD